MTTALSVDVLQPLAPSLASATALDSSLARGASSDLHLRHSHLTTSSTPSSTTTTTTASSSSASSSSSSTTPLLNTNRGATSSHVPGAQHPTSAVLARQTTTTSTTPFGENSNFTGSVDQSARLNRYSLASIARDRTNSVLSNLVVRTKASSSSLHASAPPGGLTRQTSSGSLIAAAAADPFPINSTNNSASLRPLRSVSGTLLARSDTQYTRPESKNTAATLDPVSTDRRRRPQERQPSPSPSKLSDSATLQGSHNKMHQTSSRLLRMTDEERPFTRDFKDLFSTLMVSLPLTPHRVRFQRVEHTFTSEEAINNLGSLKFSQSNRMPDPKDPTRIVTTTTTTTFSMAKEMARSVCQRFMDARFIETADGRPLPQFPLKGAVWQLTPKGMHVLTRFCQRNGINQRHVLDVLDSPRNAMQLVIMERDASTDKLSHDRATIEVIFRRFAGQEGPNIKSSTSSSDSDSVNDYYNGLIGVKMAKERRVNDKIYANTFTGKAAVNWLMDCCTTVDRRETLEIAELFVVFELIQPIQEDRAFAHSHPSTARFQPTKNAIYILTQKGQEVAGWIARRDSPANGNGKGEKGSSSNRDGRNNVNRLMAIVDDPALRLLFREFLRDTHCEENLAFFIEVREFTKSYDNAERAKAFTRLDAIRESLAQAYGLYNAFLAPGSPCELNIDHNLRNSLAGRMTRAVGDDDSMLRSLQEVVGLFKEAKDSVFKLMSSDSVPKFLKEPKYSNVLREHNFEHQSGRSSPPNSMPERTLSRVARDARGS